MNPASLITFADVAARFPVFPEATLRDWSKHDLRGFRTRCTVLAGGRRLVDLDAFNEWLEAGRGAKREKASCAGEVTPRGRHLPLTFREATAQSPRPAGSPRPQGGRG